MRIILRPSGEAAAEQRFAGRRSGMNKSKLQSVILRTLVYTAAFITFGVLICLIAYILIKGIPNLSLDLFSFEYNSENVSLFPALINTVVMTALSLVIAVPLGVFSAIYLVEYAKERKQNSWSYQTDCGDAFRNTVHSLWIVRIPFVCHSIFMGIFPACGSVYFGYYDTARHNENH